jgi:hypothetical protein
MRVVEFGDQPVLVAVPVVEQRRHDAARLVYLREPDRVELLERRRMVGAGALHVERLLEECGGRLGIGDDEGDVAKLCHGGTFLLANSWSAIKPKHSPARNRAGPLDNHCWLVIAPGERADVPKGSIRCSASLRE